MPSKKDRAIIRELAARTAAIAGLPVQEEKRRMWRKLNALRPERPMVMIDQVCWNEVNPGDAPVLHCESPDCRIFEEHLRRTLCQWEHFSVDMVVEPFVRVPKAIHNTGFGVEIREVTAVTDPGNAVVGHLYFNQFQTEADLEKIRTPRVRHDVEETDRRVAIAHELFDGLLEVRPEGLDPYLGIWDPVSTWMGVQHALFALIEQPDYMHRLAGRVTEGYLALLDQLEEQGLLCGPQSLIHCTGAYTDDLPAPDHVPGRSTARDLWMFGLAQMFSAVSPQMFKEFEVDYTRRICARFGLVYYGCCDPLDGKMNEVRLIPNVRKISMSPWADQERGADAIGKSYVFSRKPNPAFLAFEDFDEDLVRNDLRRTRDVCARFGCPLEIILKDVSTIRYQPERLSRWAAIAMEVVSG